MASATDIKDHLIERGLRLFASSPTFVEFTKDREADSLVNDLAGHPHAFVIACVMDRQIKAERAWLIPHRIKERLGTFSFAALAALTRPKIRRLMTDSSPLHRFVDEMTTNFHEAIGLIAHEYGGVASKIWSDRPSSATVIYRFLEFRGVGPKIATMAANILARDLKVPFSDYYSIDVSVDVHIRRVFARLGLAASDASVEAIIYRARALHPEFPGLLDFPCWEIGRNWCRPTGPLCSECHMNQLCPSARGRLAAGA